MPNPFETLELINTLIGGPPNEGAPERIDAITFLMMCSGVVMQDHYSENKEEMHAFSERLADSLMNLGVTPTEVNYVLDVVMPRVMAKQDEAHWTPNLVKEEKRG